MRRRTFLLSLAAWFAATTSLTRASIIHQHVPWAPFPTSPPQPAQPGPWQFFTFDEARAMEAIVDRIIPPDPETPGGKGAGCAVFIDRQLKGPYGSAAGLYRQGPFAKGSKEQGPQSELTHAELYRKGLAGLDKHCKGSFAGKAFADLSADEQDGVLKKIEAGEVKLEGVEAQGFFDALLKDVPEGFFSARDNSEVTRINRDSSGQRATGRSSILKVMSGNNRLNS
jgi:gluconate 2-dehydrogenase gamma chain